MNKLPQNVFCCEPKKQLRSVHEIKGLQNKKFKSIIWKAGVSQTVTNSDDEVLSNGRTSHKMTCWFCCNDTHTQAAHNATRIKWILWNTSKTRKSCWKGLSMQTFFCNADYKIRDVLFDVWQWCFKELLSKFHCSRKSWYEWWLKHEYCWV